jgi:hypothetical protein
MSSADRPILAWDLAGTVAYAGVDPTLEGRALQNALRRAIGIRGGSCWWDVDHAGWVVTLSSPNEADIGLGQERAGLGHRSSLPDDGDIRLSHEHESQGLPEREMVVDQHDPDLLPRPLTLRDRR